jgi:SnoaL-like domain
MMVRTDDYVAILDLYATYNHLADGDDPVAYGDCYSPDGTLRSGGRDLGHTRAEIIEFRRKNIAGREGRVRRHFTTNVRLEAMSPTRVTGQCYMQAFDFKAASEARLTHSGTYKDVLVKTDGRWFFSSRELAFDFVAG